MIQVLIRGSMIRVLIAEDSPHIRESLSSLLAGEPDIELVGAAGDGLEAVEKAAALRPDVVIMDAQMPLLDGVEATRRIKKELPGVGVLFFSIFTDYVEASIAAGSDGYVTKDCSAADLFCGIRRIAAATASNS